MVTYTGEVTYTTASDENDRVLLKVMTDSGDVHRCFKTVGKTNSCYLTESRVRLLRARGVNSCANASFMRCAQVSSGVLERVEALLKHGGLGLVDLLASTLSDKLIKRWHCFPPFTETLMFYYNFGAFQP